MSARRAIVGLAAAALVAAVTDGAAAQSGPPNLSSHDAAFFTDLLAERVWVYERPHAARAGERGAVWAVHHAADGTARACIHLDGAWQTGTGRWRVVPSARFRALYNYQRAGTEPDPGHVRGHVPLFYDPATGRLHSESVGPAGSLSEWFVLSLGWLQESWPRALKDACPDLDLAHGLPVNERQTSAAMEEAVAQDPDAAVRGHPGSHLRAPGSTGLGLAAGAPTVTADELGRFLAAHDGHVLESTASTRLVLALGSERDELWRLGADGTVTDTALLLPTADGGGIVVQWERLPRRQEYRVGDPFPLRPTGVRHGAFLFTDRLVASGESMKFPFGEDGNVALRFHDGGAVTAPAVDGGEARGRWWWSRGHLHVALDGNAETIAWPWQALSKAVPGLADTAAGGPAGRTGAE